jgi:hypothetical protein
VGWRRERLEALTVLFHLWPGALMGLAERRAAQEFETKRFPQFQKEIHAAVGFEVPIEVNWDSITLEGAASSYDETWPKIYFQPLIKALQNIGADQMGKDALKASLKKITISNRHNHFDAGKMVSFDQGTLHLDHHPTTNAHAIEPRAKAIQKLLESKL